MKLVKKLLPSALVTLFVLCTSSTASAQASKAAAEIKTIAPVRSVFVIPSNVREGRDPFFPESPRVFQTADANAHTVELTSLAVKGYYRDSKGALVVINNHTFAVGDEGDVLTTSGRVHIRCMEIKPNMVVIDINGQRRELPVNQ